LRGNYYSTNNFARAIDEYDLALRLNPNSWEAYYQKAYLFYNVENNVDLIKAFEYLNKASLLNRGSELADIKYEIARVCRHSGFCDKSKEVALEVFKLDGDSIRYLIMVFTAELYLGNNEKALELAKKGYEIDSTNIRILQILAEAYRTIGSWEESLKYQKKYDYYWPKSSPPDFNLGYAYLKNGYKKEAEEIFNILMKNSENYIKINPKAFIAYFQLAEIYASKGNKEKAYENLKSFGQMPKFTSWNLRLLSYHCFDNMREEPEFKKIVREMEAKFQAEHERIRKWLEENKML